MSTETRRPVELPTRPDWDEAHRWDDPERCPFCGAQLPDGGVGFVDHIAESEVCERAFERWRTHVADDVPGEWSG